MEDNKECMRKRRMNMRTMVVMEVREKKMEWMMSKLENSELLFIIKISQII